MPIADRFTELLTAWSTFGGAVGSVLAVVVAYFLLRKEIRTRAEEKRDAEAAVARLVTVKILPPVVSDAGGKVAGVTVAVHNHSSEPILDAQVVAQLRQSPGEFRKPLQTLDPHTGQRVDWPLPFPIVRDSAALDEIFFDVGVIFTDSRGLRWTRRGPEQPKRWYPGLKVSRQRRLRWWLTYRRQDAGRLFRRGASWIVASVRRLWPMPASESAASDSTPPNS